MNLYIVRHGEAGEGSSDDVRELTPHGQKETEVAGRILAEKGTTIAEIIYSTRVRACQTAKILADVLSVDHCEEKVGLGPNDSVDLIVDFIEEKRILDPNGSLMVVGHLPCVGELMRALAKDSPAVRFKTATIAHLQGRLDKSWEFQWFIEP